MNLVKFIYIGTIISIILGVFGRFPFGVSSTAISLTDILAASDILIYFTWVIITKSKIVFPKTLKIWGVFLIVCSISLILSLTRLQLPEILPGFLYLLRFVLYSLLVLVSFNLIYSQTLKLADLVKATIFTGVSFAIFGIIQFFIYPDLTALSGFGFDPHQGRLASTLLDPNFTGAFLVLTFGLILSKVRSSFNWSWLTLFILVGVSIILTYSRSAYLMLGVFLLLYSFHFRRLLIFLLLGLLLVGVLSPRFRERVIGGINVDRSASERIVSWNNALKVFQLQPIFGVGFNNLRVVQNKLNLFKVTSVEGGNSGAGVDSGFLFVLATTGTLGLLVYLYFWICVLKKLYLNNSGYLMFCLVVAWIINGQFINSLFLPSLMLIFFSLLVSDPALQ